jgi:hypothetical protein
MAITYKYRLVVVAPRGNVNAINNHMLRVDPSGGLETLGKDLGLHSNPNSPSPSHHWCSLVYRDEDIDLWKDLIGDFGAVDVWTWHMYGPNDDLDIAWSGVGNVRVQQVVQQDILTELGLNKLLPD